MKEITVGRLLGAWLLSTVGALAAVEWEDPAVSGVNKEPARAVSFPITGEKQALESDEPETSSSYLLPLNGEWFYLWRGSPLDRPTDFFKPGFNPESAGWSRIDVPSCVECRGFGIPIYTNIRYPHMNKPPFIGTEYNPVSSYLRTFIVPSGWKGREVFLRFEGVYSAFYLWVNGKYAGYSEDSKLPAEFRVTKYLSPNGMNTVAVQVYRWCDGSYLEDQDMFRFSGIYRDVMLYSTPSTELHDFFVKTPLDAQYRNAKLSVSVKARALAGKGGDAKVSAKLVDAEGKQVLAREFGLTVPADGKDGEASFEEPVQAPRLWSAEDPYLYTLVLTLKDAAGEVDVRSCKVGFRQVEIKNGTILLNGRLVKFKGVNRHEASPENGRAISRELMRKDIQMFKQNNINTVRTCHYPDNRYWYDLCDQYGIYVVAEANVESHGSGYGKDSLSNFPEWKKSHVERNLNNVANYKNHPSIFMWSLGNEAGSGPNFKAAADAVHAADSTRPVHYERANAVADVDSAMYMTVEALLKRGENRSKPFFMCEYAHSMGNALGNFKEYWEAFYSSDSLSGGCIWDWIDQALWKYTDRIGPGGARERYLAYGGDFDDHPNDGPFVCNGVIAAERKVSPKLVEVKRVHQNLVVSCTNAASGTAELWNRFAFTDASAFDGRWELICNGRCVKSGALTDFACAPLSRRMIALPAPKVSPQVGDEYFYNVSFRLKRATLWADAGFEIARSQLPFAAAATPAAAPEKSEALPMPEVTRDNASTLEISGRGFTVSFDKLRGDISRLVYDGKVVWGDEQGILRGPVLNTYRAFTDNDQWMRTAYYASGLSQMDYRCRSLTVRKDGQSVVVTAKVDANGFKGAWYEQTTACTIAGDGTLRVETRAVPHGNFPPLPRIGVKLMLDGAYENMNYYGRGPWENYVDRCSGSDIGMYLSTVANQYVDYVRPQECGCRTEVRWVTFTDIHDGHGVRFSFPKPMAVTATHFTSEDLEFARHRNGQERIYNMPVPRKEICLALDAAQMGLGGASCGPKPMEKYILKAEPVDFTFVVKPEKW